MKKRQALKEILCQVHEISYDKTAMFLKLYDIIEYFEDDKTVEFKNRIEKEYPILKEIDKEEK